MIYIIQKYTHCWALFNDGLAHEQGVSVGRGGEGWVGAVCRLVMDKLGVSRAINIPLSTSLDNIQCANSSADADTGTSIPFYQTFPAQALSCLVTSRKMSSIPWCWHLTALSHQCDPPPPPLYTVNGKGKELCSSKCILAFITWTWQSQIVNNIVNVSFQQKKNESAGLWKLMFTKLQAINTQNSALNLVEMLWKKLTNHENVTRL